MPKFDCDLFVIGAGSGGVRAARVAAGFGARAIIAENYRVGGTCVIRGCVPKKLLAYAAHYAEEFEDARGFGWSKANPAFSWPDLIRNKDREIGRLSSIYSGLLARSGVAVLEGTARMIDPHTVAVGERRLSARYVLVASGAYPFRPPLPGIEHAITSNGAFELRQLPGRILIVGGGYVAVEFAGIFAGLGSKVTLSYRGEQILRGFDDDVRSHLHEEMDRKGVHIVLHSGVTRIDRHADGTLEVALTGLPEGTLVCDAVMIATGRIPNTAGIGLAEIGVELDGQGGVVVDRFCRSSVASIYAVGDVTHRIALTPVAIREGAAVATTLFGGTSVPVDHADVPSAVFSQPPVGTVGLTQSEALERYGELEVYRTTFRPLRHTLSGREEYTMMKLVVDAASQRVVGAHMVGADAPEIIQGVAIAVKAGLTKAQFDSTVGIHPTAAEEFVTLRDKILVHRTGTV